MARLFKLLVSAPPLTATSFIPFPKFFTDLNLEIEFAFHISSSLPVIMLGFKNQQQIPVIIL